MNFEGGKVLDSRKTMYTVQASITPAEFENLVQTLKI